MTKFLNISTDSGLGGNNPSDELVVSQKALSAAFATKQDTLVSGTNIKTVNGITLLGSGDVTISATVDWGFIGGTLTDQADLVNALSLKANDSDVVHLSGAETISGRKTFFHSSNPALYVKNTYIDNTTTPTSTLYSYYDFIDKNDVRLGVMGVVKSSVNGDYGCYMQAGNIGSMRIMTDGTRAYTSAPVPNTTTSTSSTQIATTGWVNTTGNNVVHLSDDEIITGLKTIENNKFNLVQTSVTKGTNPSATTWWVIQANDVSNSGTWANTRIGAVAWGLTTSGTSSAQLAATQNVAGSNAQALVEAVIESNGTKYGKAPMPAASSSTSEEKIATTGWVNDYTLSTNIVHRTGNETITGNKTFQGSIFESTTATAAGTVVDFTQMINGARRGQMRTGYNSDGSYYVQIGCNGPDAAAPSGMIITRSSSATTITVATTPTTTNKSNQVATTAFVHNLVAPGIVVAYAKAGLPTGWLLCDGSAVSRTTYADLFSVIGTTYGTGDGSTTFNLPNLNANFVIRGNSTVASSTAGGIPNVTGTFSGSKTKQTYSGPFYQYGTEASAYPSGTNTAGNIAGFNLQNANGAYNRTDTNVYPRSLTMRYIIKY